MEPPATPQRPIDGERGDGFRPVRIVVDSWDPAYGTAYGPDEDLSEPEVDLGVEVAVACWAPRRRHDIAPAREVLFVDGVQRVDARLTLVPPGEDDAIVGVCGSFAAGALRCRPGVAAVESVEVRRGLFSRATSLSVDCGRGVRYAPYAAVDTRPDRLVLAMTEQMRALEKTIALRAMEAELVVIDGPLSGSRHVSGAVGLVKTHRQSYLPDSHRRVAVNCAAGERTPLFVTRTHYSRYSWYLRLPGPATHPWWGIIRLEASNDLPLGRAVALADLTAATLPRFASQPHREPRAPQNPVPVGALEQHLRHRLGDAALLERMLRNACAAYRG